MQHFLHKTVKTMKYNYLPNEHPRISAARYQY